MFSCLVACAAYFGFGTSSEMYLSRSTKPHRLRAIQAMTKVELCGIVRTHSDPDFLSTTRLIRASLGCLTNLKSFELVLQLQESAHERREWRIDDSMFSKSPSLKKLVCRVWTSKHDDSVSLTEVDGQDFANELLHRLLKQEDFSDNIECFCYDSDTAAATESPYQSDSDDIECFWSDSDTAAATESP